MHEGVGRHAAGATGSPSLIHPLRPSIRSTIFYYPRPYITLIDQLKLDMVGGRADAMALLPNLYVGISTNFNKMIALLMVRMLLRACQTGLLWVAARCCALPTSAAAHQKHCAAAAWHEPRQHETPLPDDSFCCDPAGYC
jgi:hypothetical protein